MLQQYREKFREMFGLTKFQWAPTLGGECYLPEFCATNTALTRWFQWAPTLGGECYMRWGTLTILSAARCFNGHPPLGVNATSLEFVYTSAWYEYIWFQWAPTLGGECYHETFGFRATAADGFQWAPTLGGECYRFDIAFRYDGTVEVSMGTHPWG